MSGSICETVEQGVEKNKLLRRYLLFVSTLALSVSLTTYTSAHPISPANAKDLKDYKSFENSSENSSNRRNRRVPFEEKLLAKLEEAKTLLVEDCPVDMFTVGISIYNAKTGKISAVKMLKSDFLTKDYNEYFRFEDGTEFSIKVEQPNYVNTKLLLESKNPNLYPLMVKYPIIKGNTFKEMAYYTPAHKALQQHDFYKIGEDYIEKTLLKASSTLKQQGYEITEKVQNLAKLLCVVEHVDHDRFRSEDQETLFNEVLALYALNKGNTYRYSVSSAGAGGMVQMIQPTYREVKASFPDVKLNSDFEAGMIDHSNAAKAMLLYLRKYNNYFLSKDSVQDAIDAGHATEEELMAAGYNSNPVRVPKTLSRGTSWKYSLPRETQIYLTILNSLDSSITTGPVKASYVTETASYRPSTTRTYNKSYRVSSKPQKKLKTKTVRVVKKNVFTKNKKAAKPVKTRRR
ncbi:MAG: hypothetical protein JNN15_05060 [Blastocatellia bacterium]|nr:hypothetical protein [Blastocatellia bacterium]